MLVSLLEFGSAHGHAGTFVGQVHLCMKECLFTSTTEPQWLNSQTPTLNDCALQDILASGAHDTDLSGNPILKDVGLWMRSELKSHFKDADIKYIDPSYMIRSTPTISADRIYCKVCPALNLILGILPPLDTLLT